MLFRGGLILLAIPLVAQTLPAPQANPIGTSITQLVIFGDSLSDTGSVYLATRGTSDPEPPPPPLYTLGEFTDGPDTIPATSGPVGLWDQQLAKILGLPSPASYLSGGTNYAVASALTGHNPMYTAGSTTQVPFLTDQLQLFAAQYPNSIPSNVLYVFWGGANDLPTGVDPATAASNVQGNIDTLASRGAKYFLWVNLPPIGETPAAVSAGFSAILDSLTAEFNNAWTAAISQLQKKYPGIVIVALDANGLFTTILNKPSAYGFVNVTTPAQGLNGINPNTYLFWDVEHPTTAADALLANVASLNIQTALGVPMILGAANAASGALGVASPGMLTLLGGVNLGPPQLVAGQLDPKTNLAATTLAQTQVFFNNIAAPLFYVQNGQTVAVAPYEIASLSTVNVVVQYQGVQSAPFAMKVAPSVPGLFSANSSGSGQGAIFNQDGTPNSSSHPAAAGETIVMFGTGEGQTNPPGIDGEVNGATSLPSPVLPLSLTIGGQPVRVQYGGAMPFEVAGLLQINAQVPAGLAPGNQPVVLAIGTYLSQGNLTIAVH